MLLVLIPACDRPGPPAAAAGGERGEPRAAMSPAAYDRRLLFLADGQDTPLAVVFDFSVRVDSTVSRTARAWIGRDDAWEPFLDAAWDTQPMRDPWRLVPHGPLHLVVGEGNEVETLLYREQDRELRLRPGPALAEWSPGGGAQFRLRQAELSMGGEQSGGTLLDIQVGHELARADTLRAGAGAADTAYDNAFLTDDDGLFLIVASGPAAGSSAWLRQAEREETFEGARLEWTRTEPFEAARRDVPTAWQLTAPQGGLSGEIRQVGRELIVLPEDAARPGVRGLYAVRGWIEVRGQRHDVSGVLRHGQG